MRVAYFDCFSGASGDMIVGALLDAGVSLEDLGAAVATLGLDGYELGAERVSKHGVCATQFHVRLTEGAQPHRHLSHIHAIIDRADLSDTVKQRAQAVFSRLADAEAKVHGTTPEQVHFHEVGAVDAMVDVVGASWALAALGIDRVTCSPVPVGGGTVTCEHGVLPVPAPATAELLGGVPLAPCDVQAELTTPTGAAILTTVADAFGPVPGMTLQCVGYGAGRRDLADRPNVLRVLVGQSTGPPAGDCLTVLETNVDDTTGEIIAYACDRLMAGGALDVFTTAIQMKKGRPATRISVLAPRDKVPDLEAILFEETATFGIRRYEVTRRKLRREAVEVTTAFGRVSGKVGWLGAHPPVFSPEYEACRRLAQEKHVPLRTVYDAAASAWREQAGTTDRSVTPESGPRD